MNEGMQVSAVARLSAQAGESLCPCSVCHHNRPFAHVVQSSHVPRPSWQRCGGGVGQVVVCSAVRVDARRRARRDAHMLLREAGCQNANVHEWLERYIAGKRHAGVRRHGGMVAYSRRQARGARKGRRRQRA